MFQIFNHLHPRDVLSLSRTSKTLHAFLNEDHARGIWRSSLATVRALPLCPPDMTEPQYACLAFDDWCHVSFHWCSNEPPSLPNYRHVYTGLSRGMIRVSRSYPQYIGPKTVMDMFRCLYGR